MECFRCGYCGQPTDINGVPLVNWQIAMMEPFVDWNKPTEQTHGNCCGNSGPERVQVTRDMAIDAGEPEMEGTWIDW